MQEEITRLKAGASLIKDNIMRQYILSALEALSQIVSFRDGYSVDDENLMSEAFDRFEISHKRFRMMMESIEEVEDLFRDMCSLYATAALTHPSFSEDEILESIRHFLMRAVNRQPTPRLAV